MVRVTFTCCIKNRFPAFQQEATINAIRDCLRRSLLRHNAKNWVYVFMPNHFHCILEGAMDSSDLLTAIYSFKTSSGMWLRYHRPKVKWQKDFYDHIHRADADLTEHISYIIANPVRDGLVADWLEYPFTGSLDYKLREIAMPW